MRGDGPRVRPQDTSHQPERARAIGRLARGHAIRRHEDAIASHVGVVCGEEDAHVGEQPGQDEGARAQVVEEQARLVE
jgi:hypothetical protein